MIEMIASLAKRKTRPDFTRGRRWTHTEHFRSDIKSSWKPLSTKGSPGEGSTVAEEIREVGVPDYEVNLKMVVVQLLWMKNLEEILFFKLIYFTGQAPLK